LRILTLFASAVEKKRRAADVSPTKRKARKTEEAPEVEQSREAAQRLSEQPGFGAGVGGFDFGAQDFFAGQEFGGGEEYGASSDQLSWPLSSHFACSSWRRHGRLRPGHL
jgi:hypothetical protein